jgi:hypothetical protein
MHKWCDYKRDFKAVDSTNTLRDYAPIFNIIIHHKDRFAAVSIAADERTQIQGSHNAI